MLKYLLEFKENIGAEMSSLEFEKYNDMSLKKLVSFLEKESIKLKELESNFTKKIQEKSELISHLKQIIKERIDS